LHKYNIIEYSDQYAKQVTDLFYDAVYSIAPTIYSLQQKQVWAPLPIDYQRWQKRLAESKPYLMMLDNRVVGFIALEKDGHINCTYVKAEFQNKGVGQKLLNFVIEVAKDKDLKRLYVEASIVAKPLFEKFNFKVDKENEIIRNNIVLINYSMSKILTR